VTIAVFDIDGTVADCTHRLHHIQETPPDWEAFRADLWKDAPILPMVEMWQALEAGGVTVLVCSGREEIARPATLGWLLTQGLHPDGAYFRPAKDYRPDDIVKQDLLAQIIRDFGAPPTLVFEDRQRCVDMWRRNGIFCCQVAKGDF
jgi:hypothetical protein